MADSSSSLQACDVTPEAGGSLLGTGLEAPPQPQTQLLSLPTGVLRRILGVIVLKPHDDLQAFQALRGCCAELRAVSDHARTHITFPVGRLAEVAPYLPKLGCLRAVTVTHRAEGMITDDYSAFPALVPALRYLHLSCVRNSTRATVYQSPRLLVLDLHLLLQPWRGSLRTLRLHSCSFMTGGGQFLDSLDFLAALPALVNLELRNVTPSLTLKLAGCASLRQLDCSDNELRAIDVSCCPALEKLTCRKNQLASLTLASCRALQYLYCDSNSLTALDLSCCSALQELDCQDNKGISALDLSQHPSLQKLLCAGGIPLALKACTALARLDISDTVEHDLDLGCSTALRFLRCRVGVMGSLTVAGCAALVEMHCNGSDLLATLDLSGCHALRRLSVFNCRLASLDLSPCAALQELYCSFSGRIRALDLSGCAALRKVSLCNCGLQSLDVAGCGALTEANCSGNELERRLELGSCALLRVLQCGQNKLARLDLSPCPQLDRLDVCSSPLLESLGTRGCSQLVAVECDDCPLLQDRLARTDSEGYDKDRTVRVVITSAKVLKVVDIKPEAMKFTCQDLSQRVKCAMLDAHNEHRRSYKFL
ncbi:MAG: hypothetical protein WDW36_002020 [Sanguina aurantia]